MKMATMYVLPLLALPFPLIDEDDIEEMDIKWNMAPLSMRADKFWKRIGKKISIQGSDVVGFDKLKVEYFKCHKMGHFARECRAHRSQERGRKESYRQGSKAEENSSKALMAIDGVGWDWSYMANEEDHPLVADGEAPTEFALMANIENKTGLPEFVDDTVIDYSRPSPTVVSTSAEGQNKDSSTSEDVASPNPPKPFVKPKDSEPKSKSKEQETPKKSQSYMANEEDHALVADGETPTEFALMANIEYKVETLKEEKDVVDGKLARLLKSSKDLENIIESQRTDKVKEGETPKKSQVKYDEQNMHSNKRPKGNQRNWNNLKSYQLGPEFVLHKKPCFNCGDFSHLANDCRKRVQREITRSQNHSYKSFTHRYAGHRPNGAHMRPLLRSSGPRPHGNSMRPPFRPAGHRPHGPSMNPRRPTMNGARPYKTFFRHHHLKPDLFSNHQQ
nr:hypothetical protein [Tanacetum cinerariifolium]